MRAAHHYTILLLAVVTAQTVFAQKPRGAAQGASELMVFDDPRPVAAAVSEIERRCHCVVTYEDPRWNASQVVDAKLQGRPADQPPVRIPRSTPLTVTLQREINPAIAGDVEAAIGAVFQAAGQAGDPSDFRVISTGERFNVVPAGEAVFDTRVTLPRTAGSLAEALPKILAAASAATGTKVLLAIAPINLMMRTTVDLQADGERFGDVLARALGSSGKALSWRLLYDFGMRSYYLSVHTPH